MSLLNNAENVDYLIKFQRSNPSFCEHLLAGYYQDQLEPGDNFIDVGARVGHHLFPMAKLVGSKGKGIGIEANSQVAANLIARISEDSELNSRLNVVSAAASYERGRAQFFVRTDFQGWSSLYESHVHPGEKNDAQVEIVELVRLDDIEEIQSWENCKFIKLDIENAEFMALRGATNILEKHKPLVVFENSPRSAAKLNDYTLAEFTGFFEKLGYSLFDIFLNKIDIERLRTASDLPSYYIACPEHLNLLDEEYVAAADKRCAGIIEKFEAADVKAA